MGIAKQNGGGIQLTARELRYNWFNQLLADHDYHFLLTGHHADDQVETILFNLFRSTGLKGLRGMIPKRDQLVRPLLSIPKSQLIQYCDYHSVMYYEDVSNQSLDYSRNAIRKQVIPHIAEFFPGYRTAVLKSADRLRNLEKILSLFINEWKENNVRKEGSSYVITPNQEILDPEFFPYFLYLLLMEFGFNEFQSGDLGQAFFRGKTGALIESDFFAATVSRNQIHVRPSESFLEPIELVDSAQWGQYHFTMRILPRNKVVLDFSNPLIVFFDSDQIPGPLTIRTWQSGDSFYPLGMKGKQSIKKYFVSQKLDRLSKRKIPIVTSNEKILWVVGFRQDDRFKITDNTKSILKLEVEIIHESKT